MEIYSDKELIKKDRYTMNSNFNYQKITNLFSNLSALTIFELFELRENYNQLNYSTTDVDVQIQKFIHILYI